MKFCFPTTLSTANLGDLLVLSDSGTWGDPATKDEGFPVLRSTNVQNGELVLKDVAYRSIPANDKKRRLLSDGDILVTTSSGSPDHIGKCCLFKNPEKGKYYYFSNFTRRLKADEKKLDPRWLYYWLTSDIGRFALRAMNDTTTGLRNINITRYLEQAIPLPHLAGQKRMTAILDKANEIRKKRRQAFGELNKLIPAIFYSMFGDPFGRSKRWPMISIGKLGNIVTGTTPPSKNEGMFGGEIPFVTPVDLESMLPIQRSVTKEGAKYSRIVRSGSTLVCCIGATIGKTDMVSIPSSFNQQINAIEWCKNIDDFYGFYAMSLARSTVIDKAIKTTLPILKKSAFALLEIPVPSLKLQQQFSRTVLEIHKLRKKFMNIFREANDLFNSLVQRAFKGEL